MKNVLILFFLTMISCESTQSLNQDNTADLPINQPEQSIIKYATFDPEPATDFKLEGFDIEYAFKIDSLYIASAYAEGDLETATHPQNWGDRLVIYCNNTIKFQSDPVGDVYLYEPHFYKNQQNDSVIIICQLAYEYYFGGEAFLLEKGEIQSIGQIEIEDHPDSENKMTDIVTIYEDAGEIHFEFDSDSLIYKPGELDSQILNNGVHYIFKENTFELKGL